MLMLKLRAVLTTRLKCMSKTKKFRKDLIHYICLSGKCEGVVFAKKQQIPPLSIINMTDVSTGCQVSDEYFNTGDFCNGMIVCLPTTQMRDWLNAGLGIEEEIE